MPIWFSFILTIIFLSAGILSFRKKVKTGKYTWTFAYITLFILCVACILYIIATFLLLGGIE